MASFLETKMPTTSTLFSAYAALSALATIIPTIFKQLIPQAVREYLLHLSMNLLHRLFEPRSNNLTLTIEERLPSDMRHNEIYEAVELYLPTKITYSSADHLKLFKCPKDEKLSIRFVNHQKILDTFGGIALTWCFSTSSKKSPKQHHFSSADDEDEDDDDDELISKNAKNRFNLTVDKKHHNVIEKYINHILAESKIIKDEKKTRQLCTLIDHYWYKTDFKHPATFDTLAMDPGEKAKLKAELDTFVGRKDYYEKVGRAWKRGYLLYGPPGTGKSSLIAAMANHLRFDVYYLQRGSLKNDAELRRDLLGTTNRSVLVKLRILIVPLKLRTEKKRVVLMIRVRILSILR